MQNGRSLAEPRLNTISTRLQGVAVNQDHLTGGHPRTLVQHAQDRSDWLCGGNLLTGHYILHVDNQSFYINSSEFVPSPQGEAVGCLLS